MKFPALLTATAALGFFNTNAGRKVYVCATPQPDTLTLAEFQALTYVLISGVGSHGETGPNTNILSYDTWDDEVMRKAKGMTDAGSPEIEVARDGEDAGQTVMRAAADTNFDYAFKIVGNDAPNADPGSSPTIRFNRGLVSGPRQPNGRNEDFDLEIYTLGLQQKQLTVPPIDGTDP